MNLIKCQLENKLQYNWIDYDFLPNSKGNRIELYFDDGEELSEYVQMFYYVFGHVMDDIKIGMHGLNGNWWDYCIDVWDFENDKFNYSSDNMTESSRRYIDFLKSNCIESNYTGLCKCNNWNAFLPITFNCILDHSAPYSHMYAVEQSDMLFYFHHSGSFEIYYKSQNKAVDRITEVALSEGFRIED